MAFTAQPYSSTHRSVTAVPFDSIKPSFGGSWSFSVCLLHDLTEFKNKIKKLQTRDG